MNIEIWSDIACPFCYIGKKRIEKALEQFSEKDKIAIHWKSYQLAPDLVTQPGKNINDYLVEYKGISAEQAQSMNDNVSRMAEKEGLDFRFDIATVANSFKAHQLAHFARQFNKQDAAEELLFKAYFSEGKNIDDIDTLLKLGSQLELDQKGLKEVFEHNLFSNEIDADIYEAQQIGVKGVPFFVFDDKYFVSGAQSSELFLEVIEKAYSEQLPQPL
jgi:predicted DsbA family dithiol-disulfide isomerase